MTDTIPDNVLIVENLCKTYHLGDERVQALRGVSFGVPAGRLIAIMGSSGSGKSTLLHLVGGLDIPDSGTVRVEHQNITGMSDRQRTLFRRRRVGIIFQTYNLLPTLTAVENIGVPWLVDGVGFNDIETRARSLLAQVHLEHRANHRPQAMSGGEQQRVAIARALLNDPVLLLADEPTGNLDSIQAIEIWQLLRRLASEMNKTVLMVTHEPAAAAYADLTYVLKDGQIIGTIEKVEPPDAALVATRYAQLVG